MPIHKIVNDELMLMAHYPLVTRSPMGWLNDQDDLSGHWGGLTAWVERNFLEKEAVVQDGWGRSGGKF